MKKILVSMFLLVFCLCLVGCERIGQNIKFDDISLITKIEITKYDVSGGYIVNNISLEDVELINYICNNFTSLKLRKFDDKNEPTSIKYNFVFFNDDNEVEIIGITAENWIDYRGHFHSIEQGEIDFNFINTLFGNNLNLTIQNETDYELVGIKDKYQAGEEVEVKMFYEDTVCTFAFLDGELLGELNGLNSIKFNMPSIDSVLTISYSEEIYKVNVIDNFDLLLVPLKEYYAPGETIEILTKFFSGPSVDVQVDGQFLEVKESEAFGYYGYEFIMPEKDVEIAILYNGFINKLCENNEHQWDEGREIEGGNGGYVMKYICELCGNTKEETITIIPPEVKIFYSLQEAFYNQFLTHEDLEEIANLNNNGPFNPVEINQDIAILIMKDFCEMHNVDYGENPGSVRCFGEYNGYYAVMVDGCGIMYLMALTSETVDEITFNYGSSQHILIWKYHE